MKVILSFSFLFLILVGCGKNEDKMDITKNFPIQELRQKERLGLLLVGRVPARPGQYRQERLPGSIAESRKETPRKQPANDRQGPLA